MEIAVNVILNTKRYSFGQYFIENIVDNIAMLKINNKRIEIIFCAFFFIKIIMIFKTVKNKINLKKFI